MDKGAFEGGVTKAKGRMPLGRRNTGADMLKLAVAMLLYGVQPPVAFTLSLINSTDGSVDVDKYNKWIAEILDAIRTHFENNQTATVWFLYELTLSIRGMCELYDTIKHLPAMSSRLNPVNVLKSVNNNGNTIAEMTKQLGEQPTLPSVEHPDLSLIGIAVEMLKYGIIAI